jgi:hypothetical protein
METLRFKQLPPFDVSRQFRGSSFLLLTSKFSRCAQIGLILASSQRVKCQMPRSRRRSKVRCDPTSVPSSFVSWSLT